MADVQSMVGVWIGTNGFRLMPDDTFFEAPARVELSCPAGGHLTSVAYVWEHPDDGVQDGLLVIGSTDDDGGRAAVWGDSWHQKPAFMTLTGPAGPAIALEGVYGGDWRWRIGLDLSTADELTLTMVNVVPAGTRPDQDEPVAYDVMVMNLNRA